MKKQYSGKHRGCQVSFSIRPLCGAKTHTILHTEKTLC